MTTTTTAFIPRQIRPCIAPTRFVPRDYQADATTAVFRDLDRSFKRVVVLLATGLGKTPVMGFIGRHVAGRIVVLAHREELIDSAVETLMEMLPGRTIGKVQGSRFNQCDADVVVCSIATVGQSPDRRNQILSFGPIAMVMIDECHHAMAPTYLATLAHFDAYSIDPKRPATVPVVGFTATLHRPDGKPQGNLWQKISIERDRAWGVKHGYLVPCRTVHIRLPLLDLETLDQDAFGDYDQARLGTALVTAGAGEAYARAALREAGRTPGIVFTPTVGAADHVAAAFNAIDFPAEVVHGGLTSREKKAIYDRFDADETLVLVNCGVLTEGFNKPKIAWVLVKPTGSPGLLDQMIGRGTRTHDSKTECIILDPRGVTREHRAGTPKALIKQHAPVAPPAQVVTGCAKGVQKARRALPKPVPASYRAHAEQTGQWWTVSVVRTVQGVQSDVDTRFVPQRTDIDKVVGLIIEADKTRRILAANKAATA